MARTITVTDDELGMTAVVRVDGTGGQFTVREVTYQAINGAGLATAGLPMLDQLDRVGVFLPGPGGGEVPAERAAVSSGPGRPVRAAGVKPAAAAVRKVATGPVAGAAGKVPAKKAKARQYRKSPELAALKDSFARLGRPSLVAKEYGVPAYTVASWVRRFRDAGHEFPAGKPSR